MSERDTIPWDQKTDEQKARFLTDHLMLEWTSGNLRPISEQLAKSRAAKAKAARKKNPRPR